MVGGVAVAGSLLIGGPLVTQLIDTLGWRGMFWVLAALGALWFAIAWALLKNTPDSTARSRPPSARTSPRANSRKNALPVAASAGGPSSPTGTCGS